MKKRQMKKKEEWRSEWVSKWIFWVDTQWYFVKLSTLKYLEWNRIKYLLCVCLRLNNLRLNETVLIFLHCQYILFKLQSYG